MALGSVARAAVPPLPQLRFCGTINGSTAIWFDDDASSANLWFQMKGADEDESAWRTVEFTPATDWHFKNVTMYNRPADFAGVVSLRVANTNDVGESAGWLACGTLTNFLRQVGTPIGTRGNVATSYVFDGKAETLYESSTNYSGYGVTPWIGEKFTSPVAIARVRYVARPDATGRNRLKGDVFQCADTEDFADPVDLFTVPADVSISGVSEVVFERPVTARYFRFLHMSVSDNYISLSELELVPPGLPTEPTFSVACSDDWTNQYAKIDWLVPSGVMCPSGVVQRAVSPAGPFANLSPWVAAGVAGSFVDATAPVAVPYYYRLRMACDAAYLEHELFTAPVRYVRGRRLERSWNDLTKLNDGVNLVYPFAYLGVPSCAKSNLADVQKAFDGATNTFCECSTYTNMPPGMTASDPRSDEYRCRNPELGVDLGKPCHITASLGINRDSPYETIAERYRCVRVYGANAADLSDATPISPTAAGAKLNQWFCQQTTDSASTYRFVFLREPTDSVHWFGNVAEIGFFGYTDQDTVSSGVLVPPVSVTVTGSAGNALVSWPAGFNVTTYRVERRTGGGEWLAIAILDGAARSVSDITAPSGVAFEYRVASFGADSSFAYSLPTQVTLEPGEVILPELSVEMSGWSNQTARLSWRTELGLHCPSSTVQRATSPHGPFADLAPWTADRTDASFVDESAAVGVLYYYRLRVACGDPQAVTDEFVGQAVAYRRSRRLERDWRDLTQVRPGVTALPPFRYLGYEVLGENDSGGDKRITSVFDDDYSTFCELKYTKSPRPADWSESRAINGAVGVDLGADYHITGVAAVPRSTSCNRLGNHAVWGGSDSYDTNTWTRLSPTYAAEFKTFAASTWYYLPMADSANTYRCVFLWGTKGIFEGETFCNIGEMAVFGWNEQDIVDSGVLVPPTEIAIVADQAAMTVSWNAGYNVASYAVQRRKAGETEWTSVASLAPTTLTFCDDDTSLRKGFYEFRVLAVPAEGDPIATPVVGCYFEPKRGMLLIFR